MFLKPTPIKSKIRIGPDEDGGYVVYGGCMDETDILLSYGVGWNMLFEEHFNKITGKSVLMFDPTMLDVKLPKLRIIIKQLFALKFNELYEYQKSIFRSSGKHIIWWVKFWLKSRRKYKFYNEGVAVGRSDKFDSFASHLMRFNIIDKKLMLKIDIEENEYPVMMENEFYENLKNVNQIIIEFHNLENRMVELEQIFSRLAEDFYLVHIHGNNSSGNFSIKNDDNEQIIFPDTIEVSFVKKDKIIPEDLLNEELTYPQSGLDFPNEPFKADYLLRFDF